MVKKNLLLLLCVFALTANFSFAQTEKLNVNFYYNTKAGRAVDNEMVHLTFMITGIKSMQEYQALYSKFVRQDGIRAVDMAPYDATQESTLCKFSFKKPLKDDYLQKILGYLGVEGVYIDNEYVAISHLSAYLGNKKKQKSIGK